MERRAWRCGLFPVGLSVLLGAGCHALTAKWGEHVGRTVGISASASAGVGMVWNMVTRRCRVVRALQPFVLTPAPCHASSPSPEGALVNSQGREPLDPDVDVAEKPRRGRQDDKVYTVRVSISARGFPVVSLSAALSGLGGHGMALLQGLTPLAIG